MQRQRRRRRAARQPESRLQRALDLARAPGRKHSTSPGRTRSSRRAAPPATGCRARSSTSSGCARARHVDDRTAIEKRRDRRRRRSSPTSRPAEIVARAPRLPRERQAEVGVHAALVELVEDDRRNVREQRILLQARGQHALGGDEHARVGREAALEPDVPADFARRASSPARRRCAAPSSARPRGAAAARSPARPPRAPAARASSCPPRAARRAPGRARPAASRRCGRRASRWEEESIRRGVPMVTRRLRLFGTDEKAGRRQRPAARGRPGRHLHGRGRPLPRRFRDRARSSRAQARCP